MAEHRCRQRRPRTAESAERAPQSPPMEAANEPMNRYISACSPVAACAVDRCEDSCLARQNRVLLEQLLEVSGQQNQLLMEILGAVNALTAAILTREARV